MGFGVEFSVGLFRDSIGAAVSGNSTGTVEIVME